MVKGEDLINNLIQYELFNKITKYILNDTLAIKRRIKKEEQYDFLKITNQLFSESYLIIKGIEDIKALKNHCLLLNRKFINLEHKFDIANFNQKLFKLCNSAELEKTYVCLEEKNLINNYNKYKKHIVNFTDNLKAHNPLVDAYYTWIIYNVFLFGQI